MLAYPRYNLVDTLTSSGPERRESGSAVARVCAGKVRCLFRAVENRGSKPRA